MILQGDCRERMAEMEESSIDAIVCDPPYELGFMGKKWDGSGIAYDQEVWRQAWRVLKPGGYILAFGGSRTYHRLACAIEDAGFEIRDCISWVYGSGFPKSLDVSKAIDRAAGAEREVIGQSEVWGNNAKGGRGGQYANGPALPADGSRKTVDITAPATDAARQWDGWGTALKPSHEPIVMARKTLSEKTVAANVLRWGCGAVNVDGCRIGTETITQHGRNEKDGGGWKEHWHNELEAGKSWFGRWPANLILGHAPGCVRRGEKKVRGVQKAAGSPGFGSNRDDNYELGTGREYGPEETVADWDCVEGCAVRLIAEQSGHLKTNKGTYRTDRDPAGHIIMEKSNKKGYVCSGGDEGTAARFFLQIDPDPLFYCAKASRAERTAGGTVGCSHPTVKPLKLMRYLVRLVTPPGGTVLDPFAGSGTTLIAAKEEGFNFIGIELEPEYVEIAEARLAAAERPPATLEDFG
ncbi:MAG: DNA methyltransferase [Methanoregulaceae archaeon]|nr:DNA methyltransferase [Methanoregulaceae archaeon]